MLPRTYKILLSAFLSAVFLLAFSVPIGNSGGNWYQQFMPNMGSEQLADISFIDSLYGYAVTQTHNILKTTNGGDNWSIIYNDTTGDIFTRIIFLNKDTGFVGGSIIVNSLYHILKTTNAGVSWFYINAPFQSTYQDDMSILNQDTIWTTMSESLTGGVFRTTDGGTTWTQQFSGGNQNPDKIYMFNARIGFMSNSVSPNIYKTTNGGVNWTVNLSGEYFTDMHFVDSLTGWKCSGVEYSSMKKTTDGGISWVNELLPSGGIIDYSAITRFSVLNRDTIWGGGGDVHYPNYQFRGILYRTTNGGNNWLFQVPDTSFNITADYTFLQFIDGKKGWAYTCCGEGGIHTTSGGDTNWLTGVKEVSSTVPRQFRLFQNYPNPFNPVTNIMYELNTKGLVKLKVFDITGKQITVLVNSEQIPGTYQVDFTGNNYSSGVYFYQLSIDSKVIDTKKMVLLK